MATSQYVFSEYADRFLRRKDGTTDDPDWATLALSPDVLLIEVGGTASVGDYDIGVVPDPDAGLTTPDVVTFTRVAETNDGIATGLVAALDAEIADTLEPYFLDAYIATAAGTTFVGLTISPDAPGFTLTLTAPGLGTLTSPSDGYLPLAATGSNVRPYPAASRTALALTFVAVDSSGNVLDDDNGCTFTVEVVRLVERHRRYDTPNAAARTPGVTSTVATAGHSIADELRVPFDGGRFGVRLSSIAMTPTDYAGIEIYYRQVQS